MNDVQTHHPQVYSHVVGAEVDEGMVDILEWLTHQGVKTIFSCQGIEPNADYPQGTDAYITMTAEAFPLINRLSKMTPELKFARIPSSSSFRMDHSRAGVITNDCLVIRFAVEDLPEVTRRWLKTTSADLFPTLALSH